MLKHSSLTVGRIRQFVHHLESSIIGERSPLKIEFCEAPHATEKEARDQGPWQEVSKGFQYGPAYRTIWFRLSGSVPKTMAGKSIYFEANIGSERTLWDGNSPVRGIDPPHPAVQLYSPAGAESPLKAAKGGESVELMIQGYTGNPQCRVAGRELPREALVETVDGANLLVVDEELKPLWYDADFGLNLLEGLTETDPNYHLLLRGLNEAINVLDLGQRETIARARKLIRDALLSLGGEIRHSLYAYGHAHLDTAWLWPLDITRKKMAHTTATQLSLTERYPEYTFVHSQASQYEWIEKEHPKLFKRLKEAIARGQWEAVGSMWVEADCNLTGAESLIRQFLYGKRYFREKLGTETVDMFLPDVFGYSAALPQILKKFNINYFLTQKISWNQINKFPHNTFWWKGIDGTKVWTHFPPANTYCASSEPKEILQSVANHRDHGRSDASMYLFGFGDGGGGPTERHLEFLRRARLAGNMPEVVQNKRAADFYREASTRSRDLATWSGELYLEYHRGTYTSQANNKKWNRETEFLMRDAELLACFRDDFPKSYPAAEIERLWKLVLLNQFHDIIPGSSVNEVYRDSDRDYAEILEKGTGLVVDSLKRIGSKFETRSLQRPVVLFHNSDAPGIMRMPWTEEAVPNSIVCGEDSYPVQLVEAFGERELIFPTPSGALGTVAVGDLSDAAPDAKFRLKASSRKIENAFFAVKFDANGNINSIESLEDGTEFVQPGKLANLFQIFEDKPLFWSAWDIDPFAFETGKDLVKSERFEIVERGPVRVTAEIEKKFGKCTIRQRISLSALPIIYFDTEIEWHEEDKLLKVAFPLNVNAARATCEIQFGNVERPTHQNTSWDMAKFEVCAQKWVDVSEADHGVALLNAGKYGHDFRDNVMRLSLLRAPKAPDPECDMGTHRFSYALMPHFGPYNYAGVVQSAYAFNAKGWCVPIEANGGAEAALPPLVSCEDRNLVIESVKKAEDSNAVIVRVYECHNARGVAELRCARSVRSAHLCNLEETSEVELEVHEGAVLFEYRPFEILTIKLEV
jgi:alpha-mannosidase